MVRSRQAVLAWRDYMKKSIQRGKLKQICTAVGHTGNSRIAQVKIHLALVKNSLWPVLRKTISWDFPMGCRFSSDATNSQNVKVTRQLPVVLPFCPGGCQGQIFSGFQQSRLHRSN